jgi:hypothetical protein
MDWSPARDRFAAALEDLIEAAKRRYPDLQVTLSSSNTPYHRFYVGAFFVREEHMSDREDLVVVLECVVIRDVNRSNRTRASSSGEFLDFGAEHGSGETIAELPREWLPSEAKGREYEAAVMGYVERAVLLLQKRRDALLESLDRSLEPEAQTVAQPTAKEAAFLTRQLRTSDDLYWQKWREAVAAQGLDPASVVMIQSLTEHELDVLMSRGHRGLGESSPTFPPAMGALLVTRDERAFLLGVSWEERDDLADALATFRPVSFVRLSGTEGPHLDAAVKLWLTILPDSTSLNFDADT